MKNFKHISGPSCNTSVSFTLKDNAEMLGLLFSYCAWRAGLCSAGEELGVGSARLVSAFRSTEDAEESGAAGKSDVYGLSPGNGDSFTYSSDLLSEQISEQVRKNGASHRGMSVLPKKNAVASLSLLSPEEGFTFALLGSRRAPGRLPNSVCGPCLRVRGDVVSGY